MSSKKSLARVVQAPSMHWVGDGFPVRSLFSPHEAPRDLSPFLLLDYASPRHFEPAERPRGVGVHPHRGFETVTIAYQGEIEHRDSAGNSGKIGPGDVQWMTAASGVLHEEMHSRDFTRRGGTIEMAQLWVNLPAAHKMSPPRYQELAASTIPTVELERGAGTLRVIAGDFRGTRGPARTFTPIVLWDVRLVAGAAVELPIADGFDAAFLVRRGEIEVDAQRTAREGDLVVLTRDGTGCAVRARGASELLVLGGEPIDEPIAAYGPFVMNTEAEIAQAIADAESGRFARTSAARRG